METLELKNTLNEIKYLLEGVGHIFKLAEEKIIKLEINQQTLCNMKNKNFKNELKKSEQNHKNVGHH